MITTFDVVLRGGTLVTNSAIDISDIGISEGRITAIGNLSSVNTNEKIDARGLHVFPGIIDSQVHFREPGDEHKEDMESGSKAAVLGGVTTVFEMPNTTPPTTTVESFTEKLSRADGRYYCDYGFFVGACGENIVNLPMLERLSGCVGVKIFMGSSTGTLLIPDDNMLKDVLSSGRRRAAVHAEDEDRLNERLPIRNSGGGPEIHPQWRDVKTSLLATERLIRLARTHRRPVHVLHVTTADEINLLRKSRDVATVECTPQHLTLVAPDCYDQLGTYAQMNPPIRDEKHRQGLWRGILDGTVDVIGSDHAPHTRAEKDMGYPNSPSGMPGVQTLLPIMLDHVNAGRLSLKRLVELTSTGPARIYGAALKGEIKVGYDADLTLVDLGLKHTISKNWLASKCGWSPFLDKTVKGWPVATILRGETIMRDDEIIGDPIGKAVTFQDP
ncbi:MAG: dihydroorotase [Alphaproteobacteria bacterium]